MNSFILPHGKAKLIAFLDRLPAGKNRWRVTVEKYRKRRSNEQNAYLWGVAYKLLEDATGQRKEDWHDYMLGEWGGWEETSLFDKKRMKPIRRSSKLSTGEFSDFVMFIQQRAAEHGLYIPDPGEST